MRIGIGHDIHRLKPTGQLYIAGVKVSDELSAEAHSDGDVVIHALVDAILGAACLGDIGEHFPNHDPKYRGARSAVFLTRALEMARAAGLEPVNVDVTILAERPMLKEYKPAMRQVLSDLCRGVPVNIKAGTNERCDAVGRGEAVAAMVVVLMENLLPG
jgi:2-C-methyl-D-erythritol 2,4-cyclodiphosphate synthase